MSAAVFSGLLVALATLIGLFAPLIVARSAQRKNNADAARANTEAALQLLTPQKLRIDALEAEMARTKIDHAAEIAKMKLEHAAEMASMQRELADVKVRSALQQNRIVVLEADNARLIAEVALLREGIA